MAFEKKEDAKPVMSSEMLRNCKREIEKFGFEPHQYEKFLRSVGAMENKEDRIVITYPNRDLDAYRDKFVRHLEVGLNDTMMFDEYSKIRRKDENKAWYETGEFCPRSFWDIVLDMKYSN